MKRRKQKKKRNVFATLLHSKIFHQKKTKNKKTYTRKNVDKGRNQEDYENN